MRAGSPTYPSPEGIRASPLLGAGYSKYGLIDADDGKDNRNRAKYYNLETMHRYGVRWKHVDDAEDKEKL